MAIDLLNAPSASSGDILFPFLEKNFHDIIHCQFGDLNFEGLCIKQIVGGNMKLVTLFREYDTTKKLGNKSRPDGSV